MKDSQLLRIKENILISTQTEYFMHDLGFPCGMCIYEANCENELRLHVGIARGVFDPVSKYTFS